MEPFDEVDLDGRRHEGPDALQPVARADLDEGDGLAHQAAPSARSAARAPASMPSSARTSAV